MPTRLRDIASTYKHNGLGFRRANQAALEKELELPIRLQEDTLVQFAKLASDPSLTQHGRAVAKRAAGLAAKRAAHDWANPVFAGLDAQERQVRSQLLPLVIAQPDPSQAHVRAEIRRIADSMTDAEAEMLYRRGDPTIRAALDERPAIRRTKDGIVSVRPFVSDEIRNEIREQLLVDVARRERPDLADTLHDIAETRSVYQTFVGHLDAFVEREAPEPVPEPKPSVLDGPITTH